MIGYFEIYVYICAAKPSPPNQNKTQNDPPILSDIWYIYDMSFFGQTIEPLNFDKASAEYPPKGEPSRARPKQETAACKTCIKRRGAKVKWGPLT